MASRLNHGTDEPDEVHDINVTPSINDARAVDYFHGGGAAGDSVREVIILR
jgi:hypothetical protein